MANEATNPTATAAKLGAGLFLLWSILHIYVGVTGVLDFIGGMNKQWESLLGGVNAPFDSFTIPTDALTANAQSHLILNFCLDVGGYGVLGLFVAWMLWKRASWTGFWIGAVAIGIADLSFLFVMVTSGVIVANWATISGPVIWFFAIVVAPFGLRRASKAPSRTI